MFKGQNTFVFLSWLIDSEARCCVLLSVGTSEAELMTSQVEGSIPSFHSRAL